MDTRDEALRLLHSLPSDASWDDVLRVVYARARAEGEPGGAARRVRELQAAYGPPTGEAADPAGGDTGMGYQERITIEPGKRGGKPCVRGLRITVYDVLDSLASGMTEDEILADFPDLERGDVRACLAFAADRERRVTWTGA